MTNYKLPEPTPCGYISKTEFFYTEDQMQQAYQAGRDAMRDEAVKACEVEADIQWATGGDGTGITASKLCAKEIRAIK